MGMFSFVCKGCGQELIEGELVRLNGCKGVYDGYGRAGGFEADDHRVAAWHDRCYKRATPEQRDDETPSKGAKNQGFGPCHLEFVPDYNPSNKTTYFVQLRGRTQADIKADNYRESMLLLTTRGWVDAHVWREHEEQHEDEGLVSQGLVAKLPAGFENVDDPHDIYQMFESLDDAIKAGLERAATHDPDEFILYVFGRQGSPELDDYAQGIVYEYERHAISEPFYVGPPGGLRDTMGFKRTGEYKEGVLYRINAPTLDFMEVPTTSKVQAAQVMLERGTPAQQKEALEWLNQPHVAPVRDAIADAEESRLDDAHMAEVEESIKHLEGILGKLQKLVDKSKKKAKARRKK